MYELKNGSFKMMLNATSRPSIKASFISDLQNDDHDVVLRRRRPSQFGLQFYATTSTQSIYSVKDQEPDLVFFSRSVTRAAVSALARRFSTDYDVVNGDSNGIPTSVHDALSQLTPRQLEILPVYARGNTVAQTARVLGLSVKGVDSHLYRIRAALGIRDKCRLALFCVACGIISWESLPNYSNLQSVDCVD